jgi:hypothetical protein
MNTRIYRLLPLVFIILLFPGEADLNASNASTGFIISGADAVQFVDTAGSPELEDLIQQVAVRFVVQFANQLKFYDVSPAPGELLDLIAQVKPRFVIQFANASQFYSFAFPVDIIGDTYPPIISNLTASNSGSVGWQTDEYAIGEVHYGLQSGNYTEVLSNGLYQLNHNYQLTNLIGDQTYYLKAKSTDRSGNVTWSSERSFTYQTPKNLYLPVVLNNSP